MAKNKTTETRNSVTGYLNAIPGEQKRKDCYEITELMRKITGFEPKMWGTSIVGFGSYHYKYESGHEGDAPLAGFSSRTNAITFYLASELSKKEKLLQKLGKHKSGKGCIYIQKLEDINITVLSEMISNSIKHNKSKYSA